MSTSIAITLRTMWTGWWKHSTSPLKYQRYSTTTTTTKKQTPTTDINHREVTLIIIITLTRASSRPVALGVERHLSMAAHVCSRGA